MLGREVGQLDTLIDRQHEFVDDLAGTSGDGLRTQDLAAR
jgi:hypothetical protein